MMLSSSLLTAVVDVPVYSSTYFVVAAAVDVAFDVVSWKRFP
jgi:hypothetical protein